MKNPAKKVLSIIMAAAMVVTMLPAFAINAFADAIPSGTKSEYSYFVKDATTNVASSENVSWDGKANFESGSYAKLSGTPLSAVSEGSGFIVSYDYVAGDLGVDTWIMNFTDGGSNRMSFINGSNDWWMRPALEISNGSKTRVYEGDFTKNTYLSTTYSDNGNGCLWWKTLRMTYVFNTDGSLDLTVLNLNDTSDSFTVTYRSNYGSLDQGHGMSDAEVYAAVSSLTDYYVGAGDSTPNHDYTGHVQNVRIFATSEAKALQLAMIKYENKMAEGKVYKNMKPAYDAYVSANKGFDAYIYGGDTSVDIATLASNLNTATANMSEFTKPTANAVQSYQANASDNGTNRAASNSVNILSANRNSTSGQTTAASQEIANCSTKIYYGETVLLYDGETQPRFPVTFSCVRTSNKTRYVHTMYPAGSDGSKSSSANASTDFDLHHDKGEGHDNCWYGSDTNNNRIDYTYNYTLSEKVGGNATNSDNHWSATLNNSTTHYYVSACRYIGTPNTAIMDFAIKWSQRSSSNQQVSGSSITNDDFGTMTSTIHTYVYNYAGIKNLISSKLSGDITNYTQGGLSGVCTYSDVLTRDWTSIISDQSNSNSAYSVLNSTTPTADNAAYKTMRIYLTNGLNTKSFEGVEGGKNLTAKEIYENSNINGDVLAYYDEFAAAYENAVAHMAAIPTNGYGHTAVASKTASQLVSDLSDKYNALQKKSNLETPTISLFNNQEFMGIGDEITIASTESSVAGTVTYKIYYDVDNTNGTPDSTGSFAFNSSANVSVFQDASHSKAIVTAIGSSTQGGEQTNLTTRTFYRVQDPTFTGIVDGGAIPASGIVALGSYVQAEKVSANSSDTISIQYKYGSGEWQDAANGEIPAFEELSGSKYASVNQITLRSVVKSGDDIIAQSPGTTSLTLAREADFDIFVKSPGSNVYYNSRRYDRDKIIIYDTVNYSDDIIFTLSADGVAVSGTGEDTDGVFTYDKENGIDLTGNSKVAEAINNAKYVTITAYSKDVKDGNYNTSATKNLYNGGYDYLIYHESFNGSVSGTIYSTDDSKGVNITAGGSATISVAADAGDKQGVSQGETGSSADIRKNSLKISGNSSGEAYAKLASNPFAANEATIAQAKENGVTISFWRAVHSQNSDNRSSIPSGNLKRDAIAFRRTSGGSESGEIAGYYMIECSGNTSYTKTFDDFFDMQPSERDQTQYTPSKYEGYWQHIAVTINPKAATVEEAITIYINGIPHDTASIITSSGGEYAAASDTVEKTIGDMLDMITDSSTYICLAHDNTWQSFTDDIYLDDIRFYSKALTQKEVWDGYYDQYSDTPTVEGHAASVTHDPTTITVYKLKSATNGMAAGSLVGQEFVDYYNVPSSNYTIEYYSYGTGLQIYHSYDSVNWEIVGDSEGRVAYQNRDEFVKDNGNGTFTPMYYRDALDEVCDAVNDMASSGQKAYAGNLIWAPHVCYNLEKNKWMMYVSISFWGDAKSAIIALESADGTPEHFLARDSSNNQAYNVVLKSNGRPNSIDPCVFYGHNADGSINRYDLYMTYGAWSESKGLTKDLCIIPLQTDGKRTDGNNADYPVTFANATWASSGTYICSSQPDDPNTCTGEGSFVIYHDGYYYLYTAFGVNDYNYVTRIFRSTSPTGPYTDYNGVSATTTSQYHGTQIMAPHYMVNDDYIYLSTGHDSVYKAVNDYGETVLIHSAHGRPVSNKANLDNGNYKATPDVAMITRQKDFLGNVTITHPMFFTQTGWTISMPEQYNGTDTSNNIKASDIDGMYSASTLHDIVDTNLSYSSKVKPSGYTDNWDFSQKLYFSHETDTTGIIYGDGNNGFMSLNLTYELSYDTENPEDSTTTYITIKNDSGTIMAEGVVALHDGIPELSYFNVSEVDLNTGVPTRASTTVWSVKSGDLPGTDFSALESAYAQGDALLKGLDGKAAQYSAESVQNLIDKLTAAKTDVNKTDGWKRLEPISSQATIDDEKDDILDAIEGLTPVTAVVPAEDLSTYEAVVSAINNIDPDAYEETEGHIASAVSTANTLVSGSTKTYDNDYTINVVDGNATQQNIDDAVATILGALNYCTKKYNISADSGVTQISCLNGSYEDNKATYGTYMIFKADSEETSWYLEVTSRTSHKKSAFYGYGESISVKVTGALTVTTETKASEQKRVRILRNYNNSTNEQPPVQFAEFVDAGSYTLPSADKTPALAYYTFDGYYIGEDKYNAGETVTISEDTDIIAKYNYDSSASFAITATALAGGTNISSSYAYNAKIELKGGENAYGWSVDLGGGKYRPFYVGADVTYYVMDSLNLVAEDKATFEAHEYSLPSVYIRNDGAMNVGDGENAKTSFNGQIVAKTGANIKECGILVAIPNGKQPNSAETVDPVTPDDYQIVVENSGQQDGYKIYRAKSTKLVGADQFAIAIKNLPEEYSYRAYVIFDNNGALETVYTDVVR